MKMKPFQRGLKAKILSLYVFCILLEMHTSCKNCYLAALKMTIQRKILVVA